MRLLDHLFALVSLAGLVAAGWWGVYQSPQNAANLQMELQQKTSAALKAAGHDWAIVTMDGQRAILSGKAPTSDAVRDAALTILTADGPGGLIFGGVTQVQSVADDAPPVSPFVWHVEKTPEGALVLSGHVPSRAIRKALLAEAQAVASGAPVEDHMQLASGAPVGNWQGIARLGLQQLASLDAGDVTLEDTRLRVNGVATDKAVREAVTANITNIAAPFQGQPLVRGASLWLARVSDSGLLLKGNVSSESERREILTLARKHYQGNVVDEMAIADQVYGGWMEGVRRGLPAFVQFHSGEMDFDPDGAGFLFMGQAGPSTLAYLKEDVASLTGPYSADIMAVSRLPAPPEVAPAATPIETCQGLVDAAVATGDIRFAEGAAEPLRTSGPVLDVLAAAVAACDPALGFSINGRSAAANPNPADVALGRARAGALVAFLEATGVDAGRLSAIGYGPTTAEQAIDSADAGEDSRPIEITVLERSE
jgi:outer membrane protein OmpA-like peptidoglycan-associated protein